MLFFVSFISFLRIMQIDKHPVSFIYAQTLSIHSSDKMRIETNEASFVEFIQPLKKTSSTKL